MNNKARSIQYFFFSQYFSDGLRITFGVLLPSLLFYWLGQFETGLTLSLGALCVSIADSPGPVVHKRNGMLYCNLFIFAVALLTGYARLSIWTMGLEVLLLSFFFSMFVVYGNRAAALGTAALLVMILMMDNRLEPEQVPGYSALILGGGLWYMLFSLLTFQIRPFRQAQQALGECIHEIAKFLRLKAEFYTLKTDLQRDYDKVVSQQVVVSQKQDAVRELLFKSRQLMKESIPASRTLLLTFVDVVDLYEQITASHYDYATIRERFGTTGVLELIADLIRQISEELDEVGVAIQSNTHYNRRSLDLNNALEQLKTTIDAVGERGQGGSNLALKKILVNLRHLMQRLNSISAYFDTQPPAAVPAGRSNLEYRRFVSHEGFDAGKFFDNLTFSSSVFKHAFRVAIVCLFGFVVTKFIIYGHHSYWVLLTIIVILKPGFSLTKQRNYQRITGTVTGGLIGIVILHLIPDKTVQFVLLLFLMVGTYSFIRINYVISVIFMTPYILILFSFLGIGHLDLVEERILDTLIGSAIAFTASYIIFPSWESHTIKGLMRDMLKANSNYLLRLAESLAGRDVETLDYRLARKEVYVSAANLSGAFQRMLSEPKRTQRNSKEVHKFVVLNHILFSSIATLSSAILDQDYKMVLSAESLRPVRRALAMLNEGVRRLDPAASDNSPESIAAVPDPEHKGMVETADPGLREQLEFMQRLSSDILKITDSVAG
ncbi:FUSC family protein [Pontibacter sp. 172403-2]|uniref:FUSC family protein n=1 Tax=Pontibacter rufus TaxID=2791028 RepID=UPI0018B004E7|nr:FUSC family membrane protein [Pontibacter sp. 172403-2]MBF9254467.1 FUSC family protein [Pontibacter sp. 172403-2]